MRIHDYATTKGTPWHVLGGALFSLLAGPFLSAALWGLCMVAYQLYDSLPRECADWQHTKWDLLETGAGALFTSISIKALGAIA